MKISEILKSKGHAVATIDPEVSLGVAVKTMATKSVGALVVSRDGRTIDGILSERDVVRAIAEDRLATDRRVAEAMSRDVVTCRPDDTVTGAMAVMTRRRHRHLPVRHGRSARRDREHRRPRQGPPGGAGAGVARPARRLPRQPLNVSDFGAGCSGRGRPLRRDHGRPETVVMDDVLRQFLDGVEGLGPEPDPSG